MRNDTSGQFLKMLIFLKGFFQKNLSLFFLITLAGLMLFQINKAVFISILVLSISVFLFLLARKKNSRLFLTTLSLFVFFHFLIFPLIYVILLKTNPLSFFFDDAILQNELLNAQKEIEEKYQPSLLDFREDIMNDLLNSGNDKLDTTINFLKNGNLLFTENYILSKSVETIVGGQPPAPGMDPTSWSISICDNTGLHITNLMGDGEKKENSLTIGDFLSHRLKEINEVKLNLSKEQSIITNKEIWSYDRIFFYSLNVFNTNNIIPKTRASNIVFFAHQFIVVTFIIGIMMTAYRDFLGARK